MEVGESGAIGQPALLAVEMDYITEQESVMTLHHSPKVPIAWLVLMAQTLQELNHATVVHAPVSQLSIKQ